MAIVEVCEVDVRARLEQEDDRKAARLLERSDCPVLVRPQRVDVGVRAAPAVDTAAAVARALRFDRRLQLADADVPVERPRFPLLQGWHVEMRPCALPELFRCLGHPCDPTRDAVAPTVLRPEARRGLPDLRAGK